MAKKPKELSIDGAQNVVWIEFSDGTSIIITLEQYEELKNMLTVKLYSQDKTDT